jgi:2',3'-cyclic-nucleotide 2'-phosphodiesterase (5'-nucleotidase family)
LDHTHNLTVIQINDTHGYLEPHPELVWTGTGASYPTLGGYARIASVLTAARSENPGGVLALDNGDTFHGTYPAIASRGEALIPLVNGLKLDAMTAHWEFAWGPEHFRKLAGRLDYPMLAINCYDKQTGQRPFPASTVINRAGLRIGVIGIAATIIDKSMPPHFSEGLRFTLGNDELPAEIKRLRSAENVDLVVLLSHLGFPQDAKLARSVDGIDIIVSGHTHNRLKEPARIEGTFIIQSGCHGSFVGRLDLKMADRKIIDVQHQLVPVNESFDPDPAMQRLVDDAMRPYRTMLAEVVGNTSIGLHRTTILHAPMDDLLLAAIAKAAATDIAFSNGWRYGAPIPPGPVTVNDLWNIIPTNPPVSTVELTGAEIWEMMEDNLERTFAADPFNQMGGYLKRFRGLTIYGKLENPPGHRVERIFSGGVALDARQTYLVAFVTAQGVPKKFGRNRRDLPIKAIDALRQHFQAQADTTEGRGRFIAV